MMRRTDREALVPVDRHPRAVRVRGDGMALQVLISHMGPVCTRTV